MLDLIRKKRQKVIIKAVFWLIIATFVGAAFFWEAGINRSGDDPSVAATVNKTKIGFDEYQRAYGNLYGLYQEIYREQLTPEVEKQLRLRQQALDLLIEQALLAEEGKRLGIKITQKELVDSIAGISAFHENGFFDKGRYLQVLAGQRLTPEAFENLQRQQLLIDKVRERIQEEISVTEDEVVQEYHRQSEQVNLSFIRLDPASFEKKVKVDEEELKAFYQENRENFRIPEAIALSWTRFEPSRFVDEATFTDAELERYYRRHLDRFEIPEQVKAAHILIQVPPQADEKVRLEKRQAAEKILQQVRAGEDFAQLARKHSQDQGSAAKGGDLGWFSPGTMVPAFERAAFALKPAEVSNLVETPFGLHIIRVDQVRQGGLKPLAEAREEVIKLARVDKSRQLALEKAMDAYNLNRREGNLETAARGSNLKVQQSGFFGRQEAIPGIGYTPEIATPAFLLLPGELARPVQTKDGVYLFTVHERRESRLPELAEVRAEAEQAFRLEKAKELARQAAEQVAGELAAGQKLETLARTYGEKVEETGLFSRDLGGFIPRIGNSEVLAGAAFALTRETPAVREVVEVDGRFVAAVLKARQEADLSRLDEAQREALRTALLARKKEEALDGRLEQLHGQADIRIAQSVQTAF